MNILKLFTEERIEIKAEIRLLFPILRQFSLWISFYSRYFHLKRYHSK